MHLTIFGMGLLGSSLARVLKDEHHDTYTITACCHKKETAAKALEFGIVDAATNDAIEAVQHADVVMLCTPLSTYRGIIEEISQHIGERTIITDVGSVKSYTITEILPALQEEQQRIFVPGHPIAGSERSGIEAGSKALFKGKEVILTPLASTEKSAIAKVTCLWYHAGAIVRNMDAEEHDLIYAHVSHMVQFIISSVGKAISQQEQETNDPQLKRFLRLTKTNTNMWRDIAVANAPQISIALKAFKQAYQAIDIKTPFPTRISQAIAAAVPPQYIPYAGTGYQDATSLANTSHELKHDPILFNNTLEQLIQAIEDKNSEGIGGILKRE